MQLEEILQLRPQARVLFPLPDGKVVMEGL